MEEGSALRTLPAAASRADAVNAVAIQLFIPAIYRNSIVKLTARASGRFRMRIEGWTVIGLKLGWRDQEWVEAVEGEAGCTVEADIECVFEERGSNGWDTLESASDHYGMRFYPFVASQLHRRLYVEGGAIEQLTLRFGPSIRFIGRHVRPSVEGEGRERTPLARWRDSTDGDDVLYTFYWDPPDQPGCLSICARVRIGGRTLAHALHYPFYHWVIALAVLAIGAPSESGRIVVAAVGALWIFFLQRWREAERPQRIHLLHGLYFLAGSMTVAWAYVWATGSDCARLIALGVAVTAILFGVHLGSRYEKRGDLPGPLRWGWGRVVRALERSAGVRGVRRAQCH